MWKKSTKKTDLRFQCGVCKKSHCQNHGIRAKKVEFTQVVTLNNSLNVTVIIPTYAKILKEEGCIIRLLDSLKKLKDDIKLSKEKLSEKLKKFDVDIKSNVFIDLDGEKINILNSKEENRELICSMDNRLLRRILDRKSHWNNAEIGTHITFKRMPNKMDPDVHAIMSFFHL